MTDAPGWPGIEARWTSSAKTGVGCALSPVSRVWFTVSHGILNEVYYPRVDQACIRDFGLIVTDGASFFAEEKRDCTSETNALEDGVPAFEVVSTHIGGRFRLTKCIVADPRHDVVLQQIQLEVLEGPPLRLFALLAPHLVNGGAHNTAWIDEYKGSRMLFAEGGGTRLAFATDPPFATASVGFVGFSDGWQLLQKHGYLTETYDHAANGNVAMTAELAVSGGTPVHVALGFGRSRDEAAFHTRGSLQSTFAAVVEEYGAGWRTWQAGLRSLDRKVDGHNTYRVSTGVLRSHETPNFPGGLIASLSIPWGASKGDDDLGGYHLVWPRDLVQTGGAFMACGATHEVVRVLRYLRTVQEADGSWAQGTKLDGRPYWHGLQLDECALPILLVDLAWRMGAIRRPQVPLYWPMVRAAAASWCATARPPARTAGKKMPATRRSPSPPRSPRCWPPPTSAELRRPAMRAPRSPASCATLRMPGKHRSRIGCTSAIPRWRGVGSAAITSASPHRFQARPGPRRMPR